MASPNAADGLERKLRALSNAQEKAVSMRTLPDGRIRYYSAEIPSSKPGPTRGAAFVTEYDPKTNSVRQWMESHDQSGKVNRVHPKQIEGMPVISTHYPPTGKELGK